MWRRSRVSMVSIHILLPTHPPISCSPTYSHQPTHSWLTHSYPPHYHLPTHSRLTHSYPPHYHLPTSSCPPTRCFFTYLSFLHFFHTHSFLSTQLYLPTNIKYAFLLISILLSNACNAHPHVNYYIFIHFFVSHFVYSFIY